MTCILVPWLGRGLEPQLPPDHNRSFLMPLSWRNPELTSIFSCKWTLHFARSTMDHPAFDALTNGF